MFENEISYEEYELELENRIKNMMWTVSGDYSLDADIDLSTYRISKYITLYDAIKQGAFSYYFSREELGLYLAKKLYLEADPQKLITVTQLACESACYDKLITARPGVSEIREKAIDDVVDHYFASLNETAAGKLKLAVLRYYITGDISTYSDMQKMTEKLISLKDAKTTGEVIEAIDFVYNQLDRRFVKDHGDLDHVLGITVEELADSEWAEFLRDEAKEDINETILQTVNTALTLAENDEKRALDNNNKIIVLDEEAVRKLKTYIEQTFGNNILNENEQKKINKLLCTGVHNNCKLFYTKGILRNPYDGTYRYKYAQMVARKNRLSYYDNHRVVKKNIAQLTDILRREFIMRNEPEIYRSDTGAVIAKEMWKVGRTSLSKVFEKTIRNNETNFVVDVLIDSSGSQGPRQDKVSLQGYILAEALTRLGIPVRITGFCTLWEYTIMNVYRDYDDPASINDRLFEYTATANNRDGLAVNAAVYSLTNRPEESKVLIVLSDGRPNDVNINKPGSVAVDAYNGEPALKDTALAVRHARNLGIAVLGVFAGNEEDLQAEKRIFGKDFAYIRDLKDFSNVVGAYLKKQISNM